MKIKYLLGILLVLVMFGCSSGELPPEPGSPGAPSGEAYAYYEGYAPPVDVFNNDKQIFFIDPTIVNVAEEADGFGMDIKVNHEGPSSYVYKYGYYYSSAQEKWIKFQFNEPTVSGSNWIKETASLYMHFDKSDFIPGENYVVTYSCKKQNNEWKCGCASQYDCNKWMLQQFIYRNVDLPPEPIEPGSIITMRVWAYPHNQYRLINEETQVEVSIESSRTDLDQIGDSMTVMLIDPEGKEELFTLNKVWGPYCNGGENRFSCNVNYNAAYTPTKYGEYQISFGSSTIPSNIKIETGSFNAVDQSFFEKYLILNGILGFATDRYFGYYYENGQDFSALYRDSYDKAVFAGVNFPVDSIWTEGWDKKEIDGSLIYQRYEGDEYGKYIAYQWLSGTTTVWISTSANSVEDFADVDAVIKAYLAKYPTILETVCTDSDGGINYEVKGNTKATDGSDSTDVCSDVISTGKGLVEYYCDENATTKYVTYVCSNGCKDGACVDANVTCTDSDGGLDYYVKGQVIVSTTSGNSGSAGAISDFCRDTSVLAEMYCDGINRGTINITCENGCSDGACIQQKNITCWSNTDCGNNQFCDYNGCAIETGQCRDIPTTCPTLYDPICGCDGKTYSNNCVAQLNKVSMGYKSTCANQSTNNLIAYYPLDGNANDASGNGINGNIYGAKETKGIVGQAYLFGAGSYINAGKGSSLNIPSSITISAWVNVTRQWNGQNGHYLAAVITGTVYDGTDYYTLRFYERAVDGYTYLQSYRTDSNVCSTSNSYRIDNFWQPNQWYHIAFTYDSTKSVLYLNGKPVDTTTGVCNSLSIAKDLMIGKGTGSVEDSFPGAIDEVKIYNRALSASEILNIYNEAAV